jgi:hypothetical protein
VNFELIEIQIGSKASIYTIHIEGEKKNELEKWIEKILSEIDNTKSEDNEDYNKLKEALDFIVNRLKKTIPHKGAKEYYFEHDGKRTDAVVKLKNSILRLYCLRYGGLLLIVGNGGTKPAGIIKTQDKKELKEAVENLQVVESKIKEAQDMGEFNFSDNGEITTDKRRF